MRAGTTRASQPTFALQRLKITNALLSLPSLSLCSLHTCSLPFFSICAASLGTLFRQRTGTQIRNSNNQYFLKERWVSVSSPKLVRYWQDMFTARMRRTISPELNWTELSWTEWKPTFWRLPHKTALRVCSIRYIHSAKRAGNEHQTWRRTNTPTIICEVGIITENT